MPNCATLTNAHNYFWFIPVPRSQPTLMLFPRQFRVCSYSLSNRWHWDHRKTAGRRSRSWRGASSAGSSTSSTATIRPHVACPAPSTGSAFCRRVWVIIFLDLDFYNFWVRFIVWFGLIWVEVYAFLIHLIPKKMCRKSMCWMNLIKIEEKIIKKQKSSKQIKVIFTHIKWITKKRKKSGWKRTKFGICIDIYTKYFCSGFELRLLTINCFNAF